MLPLAHVDHVALEKVVEERSDDGNGGEPSDFVPRRRDRRTDDVRSELERETRDEPPREPDPDRAALVATRVPRSKTMRVAVTNASIAPNAMMTSAIRSMTNSTTCVTLTSASSMRVR